MAGLLATLIISGATMRTDAAAAPAAANCNPNSFLENVWQDLLERGITPGEKALFLNLLNRGGNQAQVAQLVLNSAEYRTKLVQRFYRQFLGRTAGPPEINFFLGMLQQGATVEQIIAVLVSSDEYYRNRGGGTDNGFIEQVYSDLLNRPADEGGVVALIGLLNRGGTRQQVAQLILESKEYRTDQLQGFYKMFLEREANDTEINFFLTLWQRGARREQLIAQIIGSPEYCELAGHPSRDRRQ